MRASADKMTPETRRRRIGFRIFSGQLRRIGLALALILVCGCGSAPLFSGHAPEPPTIGFMIAGATDCPMIVTIEGVNPDTRIFYTLDGSTPGFNKNSMEYRGPFKLTHSAKIQAVAYDRFARTSPVAIFSIYCSSRPVPRPLITPPPWPVGPSEGLTGPWGIWGWVYLGTVAFIWGLGWFLSRLRDLRDESKDTIDLTGWVDEKPSQTMDDTDPSG